MARATIFLAGIGLALLLVVGLAGCAAQAPSPAKPEAKEVTLRAGTTGATSSHMVYGVRMSKVLNERVPGLNVTVVETGATIDNIKRMGKKQVHFGITVVSANYEAVNGLTDTWKNEKYPDLRVLWMYNIIPETFVARADSGVKTIYDLDGKPWGPSLRGSASEKMAEAVMDALGIKPQYFRGSLQDQVEATKDKRIVGLSKSSAGAATPDASLVDLQTLTPIVVLGLSDDDIKKVLAKYPYYPIATLKAGTYKGQDKDINNVAQVVGYSTMKDLISNELAYNMVKAMWEGQKDMEAAFPAVQGVEFRKLTVETTTAVPIHAGAVKYYQELGYKLGDAQIPPEAKK